MADWIITIISVATGAVIAAIFQFVFYALGRRSHIKDRRYEERKQAYREGLSAARALLLFMRNDGDEETARKVPELVMRMEEATLDVALLGSTRVESALGRYVETFKEWISSIDAGPDGTEGQIELSGLGEVWRELNQQEMEITVLIRKELRVKD